MEGIQLDRAEFETPQVAVCSRCGQPFGNAYFQVNGTPHCGSCVEVVRSSLAGGSRIRRGLRALGAGLGAALAGSLLYLVILWLTGYEFGLIAIVVGWGVGKAVSWGSGGRGGWRYQTMAIALTYVAIVGSFVPLLLSEAFTSEPAAPTEASEPERTSGPETPVTLGVAVVSIFWLGVFIAALPFLGGFENIMGLVILGIGLFEAWKLNKRQTLEVSGPHVIAPTAEPTPAS